MGRGLEERADPLGLGREVDPPVLDLDGLDELPDPVVLSAPCLDAADPEVRDDLLDPFVLTAGRGGEAEHPATLGPVGAVSSGEGHVGVLPHGVMGLVEDDQRHLRKPVAVGGQVVHDDLGGREDHVGGLPSSLPDGPLDRSREPGEPQRREPAGEGVGMLLHERSCRR